MALAFIKTKGQEAKKQNNLNLDLNYLGNCHDQQFDEISLKTGSLALKRLKAKGQKPKIAKSYSKF